MVKVVDEVEAEGLTLGTLTQVGASLMEYLEGSRPGRKETLPNISHSQQQQRMIRVWSFCVFSISSIFQTVVVVVVVVIVPAAAVVVAAVVASVVLVAAAAVVGVDVGVAVVAVVAGFLFFVFLFFDLPNCCCCSCCF